MIRPVKWDLGFTFHIEFFSFDLELLGNVFIQALYSPCKIGVLGICKDIEARFLPRHD